MEQQPVFGLNLDSMRILILTQHIGKTAPGKVFETLVLELAKHASLTIFTCHDNHVSKEFDKYDIELHQLKEPTFINKRWTYHLNMLFLYLFGIAWRDWTLMRNTKTIDGHYDMIFSLCSMHNCAPLALGAKLKKAFKIPLACYFVDAIPTPQWWKPSFGTHKFGKYVRNFTENVDYFASSNEEMLNYQKQFLASKCSNIGVIYTPSENKTPLAIPEKNDSTIRFLYTGSIYGLRNPKFLFEAFERFIDEFPNSEIHFVGTSQSIGLSASQKIKHKLHFHPFTENLNPFYQQATALIDMDAATDNDIFLSSKVMNYLTIPRPIICETGKNSPARRLLSGYKTITVCDHNATELLLAMKNATKSPIEYTDRLPLIYKFNAETIVGETLCCFKNLIK